jgi:ABC-2 type transport system ATP-binding protein
MSVEVRRLTKNFGLQKAVDRITFNVRPGDIMGFLGPNGAGKSTTMKIITGYLPQTEGTVMVCGKDVETHPHEIKKNIGYLPENNPLYPDMYIREYLTFVGSLYINSKAKLREAVAQMIKKCGLSAEANKKIGALSKGYRQRVGLAQALLHDPPVLILDEPTTGLDPNQIIEIRTLIKEVSKDKTVIFSTHIMQEVQALCNKIIIINRGRIVANDVPEKLRISEMETNKIIVEFKEAINTDELMKINGVMKVDQLRQFEYRITAKKEIDVRPALFKFATDSGYTLIRLNQLDNSMEEVFRQLTKNNG